MNKKGIRFHLRALNSVRISPTVRGGRPGEPSGSSLQFFDIESPLTNQQHSTTFSPQQRPSNFAAYLSSRHDEWTTVRCKLQAETLVPKCINGIFWDLMSQVGHGVMSVMDQLNPNDRGQDTLGNRLGICDTVQYKNSVTHFKLVVFFVWEQWRLWVSVV